MNAIGIDLGTTNSVACILRNGQFEFLKFSGKDILPSAVLYDDGNILVGDKAKRKSKLNAEHFISSAKTFMGDRKHKWKIDNREFTATDVAAEVLREIYKAARNFFGNDEPIQAVITTPAQFSATQNGETKIAGENAGFTVKQILAEPIAAAMAYVFENPKPNEKIYVVDLGGGTFDVALLETAGQNKYETLFKDGNRALGGDNFDQAVVNLIMNAVKKINGVDLSTAEKSKLKETQYKKTLQKIYLTAEKVKCALSTSEIEKVDIDNLFPYGDGYFDLHTSITREDFLKEAAPYVKEVEKVIRRSFENTEYNVKDVDRIILVGGSANMPFVRKCVKKLFDKDPYSNIDLSKLVAMGAAILADDELGNGIELHDKIAHSFGIKVIGERLSIVLKKDEQYPCYHNELFETVADNQKNILFKVYEGEDTEDLSNDRYIGEFWLKNIELAPAGKKVDVRFEFDESCILHVTAEDPVTKSFEEIYLNPYG